MVVVELGLVAIVVVASGRRVVFDRKSGRKKW